MCKKNKEMSVSNTKTMKKKILTRKRMPNEKDDDEKVVFSTRPDGNMDVLFDEERIDDVVLVIDKDNTVRIKEKIEEEEKVNIGCDLFWKAFVLRSCAYLASHYTDQINDYKNYVASLNTGNITIGGIIPETKLKVCIGCKFKKSYDVTRQITCLNCPTVLSCGKAWCSSMKNLKYNCVVCKNHLCLKCSKVCNFCRTVICKNCGVYCHLCKVTTCRNHVEQCDLCMKFLFCPCREHECNKRIKVIINT